MGAPNYPLGYGELHPKANYLPWKLDSAFSAIYRIVAAHTLIDEYRCYALYQLLQQVLRRTESRHTATTARHVLEVGVRQGGSGALLAETARISCAPNATPTTWLADTFTGVVKAGEKDDYYKGGEHADTSEEIVLDLLKSMQIDNCRILHGVFPEETATEIEGNRFCFCHIDVDVYQSAKDVLYWVWPRLEKNGVVVFDDYGFWGCEGVTALVNEEREGADRLFFYNLNGHAMLVKLE